MNVCNCLLRVKFPYLKLGPYLRSVFHERICHLYEKKVKLASSVCWPMCCGCLGVKFWRECLECKQTKQHESGEHCVSVGGTSQFVICTIFLGDQTKVREITTHAARETRNTHVSLRKRPLRWPMHRWVIILKCMFFDKCFVEMWAALSCLMSNVFESW